MSTTPIIAPELTVAGWVNCDGYSLRDLRGKVVVIHAFQMLCPGCVTHGIPQVSAVYELYGNSDVQVIGLHTVFEHHDVMTHDALKVFVDEYRLEFPIAIDQPSVDSPIPLTMQAYGLQGTPSLVLVDAEGYVRLNHFGRISDMQLGNIIGQLIAGNYFFNKVVSAAHTDP